MKRVAFLLIGMAVGMAGAQARVCDVRAFGAKGDSVAMDTAAIQAGLSRRRRR